ncbi:NADH-quinone oxidoreductase subunit M [Pacificimonas flava]|uniref:NADH-ubiquinone oxidoreductase chain M n=1 Tax=Pacificimonas flava TaxID=1234595 RepID=M2TCB6_9SPHN|nr:NADH-quinone oxidoreductase subunit M [Pacificimonas flava]EMD84279.1 NADH-ubiquinone oxidoreductase chain M [Pacificimonas flava]MBB5279845.1 NADH-quinone oxidoreductase subunit M [Pacificimonas flava]
MEFPILTVMILLPLISGAALLLWPGDEDGRANSARWLALGTTLIELVLGIALWLGFDTGTSAFQYRETVPLFEPYFSWALGIDGISLVLIALSVFLMPICILASWQSVKTRVPEYMAAFMLMEALMIGVFAATDLFLFYVMFEGGLIPMYLIIGIWGGTNRIYASYKFFLYTLLGSVLMLLAMMYMVSAAETTDIPTLMAYDFDPQVQVWLWLAFFASFAVKMPMWPVHTWLPDAHVQAPTAGSVILAGVLLKMGGYGFIRFSLPMFPDASVELMWLVFGLSMVAVVYTSLVALAQNDMKKLIAYSSVAHMAFVTVGLFGFNQQALEGSIVVMLSHGLVSGALFLCVGVVYDRLHTREISAYGGVANIMPRYAIFFMLFTMASVGLPGTSGFVGEFLVMLGAFKTSTWAVFVVCTGIILGAAYMLFLYRRVVFGTVTSEAVAGMRDLSVREYICLVPIAVATLWMGIAPNVFIDPVRAPVADIVARLNAAGAPQQEVAGSADDVSAPLAGAANLPARVLGAVAEATE